MPIGSWYLIDTNILLGISRQSDAQRELIGATLKELERQGANLYYSLQNIAEFWNVCTRPVESNGYGLPIAETNQRVKYIESTMTLLPDTDRVYSIWRQLVVVYQVRGVKVHDARLAATMQAHGVANILTLNRPDSLRYSNLHVVHPAQLAVLPE
jgi:predicted nucleic acid-binding protein